MEPGTHYALTPDGVRITLYTLGQGPAAVVLPTGPWSSIPIEKAAEMARTAVAAPDRARRWEGAMVNDFV